MIRRVRMDGFEPADLPAKFEAGTPPIVSAIGLKTAIDYLQHVGLDAIGRHARLLTQYAHQQLEQIGDVRILGPGIDQKAGIVSFLVAGIHPHDVAQLLDRQGIAIRAGHHCAMPLHQRLGINASCRASFYLYNTFDDVDQLVAGIQAARRTFRRI
jgi:cysteine desulfurase/selenocysteine lyase